MSRDTAGNAYDKVKVIAACDRALKHIEDSRQEEKVRRFSGKKEYWLFGRELTVEEAFSQSEDGWQVSFLHGRQKISVTETKTAAMLVAGDVIYLTPQQLCDISGYWDVV